MLTFKSENCKIFFLCVGGGGGGGWKMCDMVEGVCVCGGGGGVGVSSKQKEVRPKKSK